jgi:hypothetical protein
MALITCTPRHATPRTRGQWVSACGCRGAVATHPRLQIQLQGARDEVLVIRLRTLAGGTGWSQANSPPPPPPPPPRACTAKTVRVRTRSHERAPGRKTRPSDPPTPPWQNLPACRRGRCRAPGTAASRTPCPLRRRRCAWRGGQSALQRACHPIGPASARPAEGESISRAGRRALTLVAALADLQRHNFARHPWGGVSARGHKLAAPVTDRSPRCSTGRLRSRSLPARRQGGRSPARLALGPRGVFQPGSRP